MNATLCLKSMRDIVNHKEIIDFLTNEVANQSTDPDTQKTAINFELNDIGASVVPNQSITGVNINASDNLHALNQIFALAQSPKLYAPFGTTSSIFLSKSMPNHDVHKKLKTLHKMFIDDKADITKRVFDFVAAHGGDKKTFRFHVGQCQSVFPTTAKHTKQSHITVSIRTSDAKHTGLVNEKITELKSISDKIIELEKNINSEEDDDTTDFEFDKAQLDDKFCEEITALTSLIDKSHCISEKMNRCIAYDVCKLLQVDMGKTHDLGKIQSLYSSYTCHENNYSISGLDSMTKYPSFSLHYGSVPICNNMVGDDRVSITMFHSPTEGSVMYSLAPGAAKQYYKITKHAPKYYSTVCDRTTPAPYTNHSIAKDTAIVQSVSSNTHVSVDGDSSSYLPLLVCPNLYHIAYNTDSTILKLNATMTILGPEIDYEHMAPISTKELLQEFIETIEPDQKNIYVPDKKQSFSQMITKCLPMHFYKYLNEKSAVPNAENTAVEGWMIPKHMLENAIEMLNKID